MQEEVNARNKNVIIIGGSGSGKTRFYVKPQLMPGIISLVLLVAAGIAGVVLFRRYRRNAEEPEDDYSENMEGDGLPTVNEDEEFLE